MIRRCGPALAAAAALSLGCTDAGTDRGRPGGEAAESPRYADPRPPPMTLYDLRTHPFDTKHVVEGPLDDGPGFSAYLVSYRHAGLKLHAMVAVPIGEAPKAGYPVVIANHGYVPDPRKYGVTTEGVDSRPGDYYRAVPELFTSRGFLVVIPDYRGHNSSEGFDFIDPQDEFSAAYYAEDVVALMSALEGIENANLDAVLMWSHSMGGSVSMRALLATDVVKASSFWSTMRVDEFFPRLGELDGPVVIQHSTDDESTPAGNSERLAAALEAIGVTHKLHLYDGGEHFFDAARRESAADIDAAHFRQAIQPTIDD